MRIRNWKGNIIFFLLLISILLNAQTNRALIVAISDYPEDSGWEKIHSVNDCQLIIPMLKANGYKKDDIKILLNENATKAKIVKAFQNLASKTRPGDYLYIHLCGHGQQIVDDNGDELDGLDEAFIPYDAQFRYKTGIYEGENHLRDDNLGRLIDAIRRRSGEKGNVIVVLDACHSGTGTRLKDEDEYIRGTSYIFAPPGYNPPAIDPENLQLALTKEKNLSPLTVFSACQPDEVNYEYKAVNQDTYYGRLTYFFCSQVMENTTTSTNYSFYIKLKEKMNTSFEKKNRKQTPYFESTNENGRFILDKHFTNGRKNI